MLEFLGRGLDLPGREMRVVLQFLLHGFEEQLVGDFAHVEAGLVDDRNHAFMGQLDQVTDHLIVEIIDFLPFDSFALVLFLFLL